MLYSISGVPVIVGKREEIRKRILEKSNTGCTVFSLNAEILAFAERDRVFKSILMRSDFNVPDGVGATFKLKEKGVKSDRYAGVDLAFDILPYFHRLAIIGAREGVGALAAQNLGTLYQNIYATFSHHGYFESFTEIEEALKKFSPDIVFVCMGAKKQENTALQIRKAVPYATVLALGGAADVFAGIKKRAPKVWRVIGIEWLWRSLSEPKRFLRLLKTVGFILGKVKVNKLF